MVGEAEARIEAFGGQVGDLERIGGVGAGDALGDFSGQAVGEGTRVVVSYNDQCMHGETPSGHAVWKTGMLG
ncbi:hypothetical protein D3C80_1909130 [compost metagenome]